MNLRKTAFSLFVLITVLSSCHRNASCPSLHLCPAANPSYFAVSGTDTASIYMPNAFTPNGDGVNDRFEVFGNKIATLRCGIYDGNTLIYEIDSLPGFWDGTINGKAPVNLYTLKLTATTSWGAAISLNGTLSAIGGEFFGDPAVHVPMNSFVNYHNSQFPDQNNHGYFDPAIPNGQYVLIDSVIICH